MAVGEASGEQELRWRQGDRLRKIFLTDGKIVGFRLAGDIRAAGAYRALMLREADVSAFADELLDPRFDLSRCVSPPPVLQVA
jgi:NAD(P)H-nitrite reductase large subunit